MHALLVDTARVGCRQGFKSHLRSHAMSNIQGKVVLITGASSGIGEAVARMLAERGAHVVLGARRIDRLEALASTIQAAGGSVRIRALDVTQRDDVQAF